MKTTEYKTTPATLKKVVTGMSCDLCGKSTKRSDWTEKRFNVAETEVRMSEGESYPEGGSGVSYTADICLECFKNKLIPWLKSQGCEAKYTDWDW